MVRLTSFVVQYASSIVDSACGSARDIKLWSQAIISAHERRPSWPMGCQVFVRRAEPFIPWTRKRRAYCPADAQVDRIREIMMSMLIALVQRCRWGTNDYGM